MSKKKTPLNQLKNLADQYFQIQKHRIAFENQVRALKEENKPTYTFEKHHEDLQAIEDNIKKDMERAIEGVSIYEDFLKKVKGISAILSASLIAVIDIEKAEHVSSLFKYAGLDVVNGEGRSRKKKHLEKKVYKDSDGNKKETKGITFNPFLKRTCWKIGRSFLMAKSPYREDYEKRRTHCEKTHPDWSDGHRHNDARRVMVKAFLKELFLRWRKLEGLPVSDPWIVTQENHHYDDEEEIYVDRKGNMKK